MKNLTILYGAVLLYLANKYLVTVFLPLATSAGLWQAMQIAYPPILLIAIGLILMIHSNVYGPHTWQLPAAAFLGWELAWSSGKNMITVMPMVTVSTGAFLSMLIVAAIGSQGLIMLAYYGYVYFDVLRIARNVRRTMKKAAA